VCTSLTIDGAGHTNNKLHQREHTYLHSPAKKSQGPQHSHPAGSLFSHPVAVCPRRCERLAFPVPVAVHTYTSRPSQYTTTTQHGRSPCSHVIFQTQLFFPNLFPSLSIHGCPAVDSHVSLQPWLYFPFLSLCVAAELIRENRTSGRQSAISAKRSTANGRIS